MRNDRDPDPHIRIVLSESLISKYVMDAWLQLVYVYKRTFSSNILLPEGFFFPLEFFILHSTDREADDVQMEQKES